MSEKTWNLLVQDGFYEIETRGLIEVKGKGQLVTFWLQGITANNTLLSDSTANEHLANAAKLLDKAIIARPVYLLTSNVEQGETP